MLEAIEISKSYGGKPVLSALSLSVAPGEKLCLTGPSGCGKTTLLRILLGLEEPDRGRVLRRDGLRLSAVFQEDRLLENQSAVENLLFVRDASPAEAEKLLQRLCLPPESLRQPAAELSGGMKRRVAIARALFVPFDLLVLDEPYKGLDADVRAAVQAVVAEETRDKAVILVTHDSQETRGYRLPNLWAKDANRV